MGLELEDTMAAPTGASPKAPSGERTTTGVPSTDRGPPPMPSSGLPAGKQLGHFRIERMLGAGGMGEVYLATDLALDRPVAIKVLPEQLAHHPKRRDRMIREARSQARVSHPNVGHMYFIGEDSALLYFAMEYVAGETVAERLARGPMSVDEALAVIRDAVLGLREAHRCGITHRDVKPSNLMIDAHGHVKVLDFGLAAGDLEAVSAGPVAQTSLAGTPLYMAPEQARGDAVDFRTDIYALGATLYHLIAGKPPFQGDSVDELVSAHASAARPALPRRNQPRTQIGAIDALCTKMMAPRPEDRFATYDDLLRAIELASTTHTRPAGFWARCIAMLLDLTMITLIAAIIEAGARRLDVYIETGPILLATFAVYQVVCLTRWGRTAGKAVMELEVVGVESGRPPSWSSAIRRSLVMFGIPIGAAIADGVFGRRAFGGPPSRTGGGVQLTVDSSNNIPEIVTASAVILGVVLLLYAAARASGKRAVWDRIAGTMVRYRTARTTLRRP